MSSSARFSVYVFFSGACALLYQTVWQRELRLIFGGSTAASGAVLATFIGGLGAGSLLLARRVEASPRPFSLYARFEALIALSTAATPLLFGLVRSLYVALGGSQSLGAVGGAGLRVVLTGLVILVPTFFMGGTLPAVARSVTSADDTQRGGVAILYGLNTLGAVCGAAFATFWALPRFGNHATLWLGCAINLVVALAAQVRARTLSEVPLHESAAAAPATAEEQTLPRAVVLAAAFTVGAVFFLMELVWFRMLAPLLGGTVFTFGLVLCVALAGIGLGGAAYGVLVRRSMVSLTTFAFTCLFEALAVAVPLGLGDRLALFASLLRPLAHNGLFAAAAGWSAVAAVVVFPAAFVSGVQFPLLIALAGRARARVAAQVAEVYAANTSGSVLGALAGGFGVLPALSAPGAWRLSAAVLLGLGLFAASASGATRRPARAAAALAIAALTIACLLSLGPTPVWRHSAIGQGRADVDLIGDPLARERLMRDQRGAYLWEKDGTEAGVGLYGGEAYAFIVDGKSDGNAVDDAATQVMAGLLGALLHPAPRRALVIGLGTGSTAGWLASVPEIERVDVFEFEPLILEVARTMSAVNRDVLDNPKVHLHLGDARELLALDDGSYDVVFSEPSNPFRVGVANLYTREYYQQIAARLKPGGLFVQWTQMYEIDALTLATVYATMRAVFPSVESWFGTEGDLLLIGTRENLLHDVALIDRRTHEEPYATALRHTWYSQSKEGVFAHLIAGPAFTDFLISRTKATPNTDDLNSIEFGVARTLGIHSAINLELVALADRFDPQFTRLPKGLDPDLFRFERWQAPTNRRSDSIPDPPANWSKPELALAHAIQAAEMGELPAATLAYPPDFEPRTPHERLARLYAWASRAPPTFAAEAESLRPLFPFDVEAALAVAARGARDSEGEIDHWVRAFTSMHEQPWNHTRLFFLALDLLPRQNYSPAQFQRLADVLAKPFSANHGDGYRRRALIRLYDRLGDSEACARYYAALGPNIAWNAEDLSRSVTCFDKARPGLAPAARVDLARFNTSGSPTLAQLGAVLAAQTPWADALDGGALGPTP